MQDLVEWYSWAGHSADRAVFVFFSWSPWAVAARLPGPRSMRFTFQAIGAPLARSRVEAYLHVA